MKRTLLWCLSLGLVTGVGALLWFGVRPWTIAFALLMLVCPAVAVGVATYAQRKSPSSRAGERAQHPPLPGAERAGDA